MIVRMNIQAQHSIGNAVRRTLTGVLNADDALDSDDREALYEVREPKVWKALEKFIHCKEYITLEFDTEAGTARVLRCTT
jgi:hypothetical protein